MIFSLFDQIRVINLPNRTDRRAEMEGELRRFGLLDDPRVAFFPACRFDNPGDFTSIGACGVYHSQLTILAQAAYDGQSVLILEDDVDFATNAASYVPKQPWEIFYGGYEAADPDDLLNSDIIGAHMMGFTAKAASDVSAYLKNLHYEGIHPPIDAAYIWYRRAFPEVATLFAEPPLGHQRPSRTDIADLRFFDTTPGLREAASLARKIKRRLTRHRRRKNLK
jgi:glycosyl transferase, family 25